MSATWKIWRAQCYSSQWCVKQLFLSVNAWSSSSTCGATAWLELVPMSTSRASSRTSSSSSAKTPAQKVFSEGSSTLTTSPSSRETVLKTFSAHTTMAITSTWRPTETWGSVSTSKNATTSERISPIGTTNSVGSETSALISTDVITKTGGLPALPLSSAWLTTTNLTEQWLRMFMEKTENLKTTFKWEASGEMCCRVPTFLLALKSGKSLRKPFSWRKSISNKSTHLLSSPCTMSTSTSRSSKTLKISNIPLSVWSKPRLSLMSPRMNPKRKNPRPKRSPKPRKRTKMSLRFKKSLRRKPTRSTLNNKKSRKKRPKMKKASWPEANKRWSMKWRKWPIPSKIRALTYVRLTRAEPMKRLKTSLPANSYKGSPSPTSRSTFWPATASRTSLTKRNILVYLILVCSALTLPTSLKKPLLCSSIELQSTSRLAMLLLSSSPKQESLSEAPCRLSVKRQGGREWPQRPSSITCFSKYRTKPNRRPKHLPRPLSWTRMKTS